MFILCYAFVFIICIYLSFFLFSSPNNANICTLLFTEKAYKTWERFLQFFGCVKLLVSMFTHIKLSGKNLQTNFDYTRLKEPRD
jgi:uncharacterized membrane protein